ncbi:FHA domain-containing protein [Xanthovirga aplysinae]|uniref:FHA domain-containing protein n=1 Tax=Xanthovirga aplysinae TaxID=2529853 RepID=UPI0012BC2D95|nr:FHA domain-containing protein [Xanthovirga aplysinae]MTI32494.1 FHA domain-containing protein [Xanthovirga aplysinae]
MASIKNNLTGEITLLNSQHVFGRSKHNHTCILESDVSKSHATICWKDGNWYLQDHSRNGTLINGEYIRHTSIKLLKGAQIQFGEDKSTQWTLLNLQVPTSYLKSMEGEKSIIELTSCHLLPNEEKPIVSIYQGIEKEWKAEINDTLMELEHGNTYEFLNTTWQFIQNEILEDTLDYGEATKEAKFHFYLSADEEKVKIIININDLELNLGERIHHFILLLLARKRLVDLNHGYDTPEQGWMSTDELTHKLGKELVKEIDAYYLNLQIHRLRKQLIEINPFGHQFTDVIERRNGEIRFAYRNFEISKEGQPKGNLLPEIKNLSFYN